MNVSYPTIRMAAKKTKVPKVKNRYAFKEYQLNSYLA